VTLTTERANPLRQWNPDWGGCSTARRPVAAVSTLCQRRPAFVKCVSHEMTPREIRDLTGYAATGDPPRTRPTQVPQAPQPPGGGTPNGCGQFGRRSDGFGVTSDHPADMVLPWTRQKNCWVGRSFASDASFMSYLTGGSKATGGP